MCCGACVRPRGSDAGNTSDREDQTQRTSDREDQTPRQQQTSDREDQTPRQHEGKKPDDDGVRRARRSDPTREAPGRHTAPKSGGRRAGEEKKNRIVQTRRGEARRERGRTPDGRFASRAGSAAPHLWNRRGERPRVLRAEPVRGGRRHLPRRRHPRARGGA
eukprot:27410-Pelagococcus_subviridis.AAC.1